MLAVCNYLPVAFRQWLSAQDLFALTPDGLVTFPEKKYHMAVERLRVTLEMKLHVVVFTALNCWDGL